MIFNLNCTLKAAALLATVCAPASAADFVDAKVTGHAPSPLVVASNGTSYTTFKVTGVVSVKLHFQYDTWAAGRVNSWKIWPAIENGVGNSANLGNLKPYGYAQNYSLGNRPKKVDRHVASNVPAAIFANNAVFMCNALANGLRQQGLTDTQIFSKDRNVFFNATASYDVDATGPGSDNPVVEGGSAYQIPVRCAKWTGASAPHGTAGAYQNPWHVKKAILKLQERALLNGTCAVKLTTTILTNAAGATLKYRYVHSSGQKSPVFTVDTGANKNAVVTHQWNVPNGAGPEIGTMRLVGVNHDFQSNIAAYAMTCKNAPGGLRQPGPKPTVRIPLGSSTLKN